MGTGHGRVKIFLDYNREDRKNIPRIPKNNKEK